MAFAVGGRPAAAAVDYDPESGEWNGLAEFVALARASGLPVEPRQALDWGELTELDSLIVLYPARPGSPDAGKSRRFLAAGGRMILADDFGGGEELLGELGIERHPFGEPGRDAVLFRDDPDLPLAELTAPDHALAAGAPAILTNHPAAFRSLLPALYAFDAGRGAVIEVSYGAGLLVAVSDPSVLINAMLRHPGNGVFAQYLLLRASAMPAGKRRLLLLQGAFAERGSFAPRGGGGLSRTVGEHARGFERWLQGLEGGRPSGLVSALLALAGAALAALILLAALPMARRIYDGAWFGAAPAEVQRPLRVHHDLAYAAALLETELEAVLAAGPGGRTGGGAGPPPGRPGRGGLDAPRARAEDVAARYPAALGGGRRARRRMARLFRRLRSLSSGAFDHGVHGPPPRPREFATVYRGCMELVEGCGLREDWRRRSER